LRVRPKPAQTLDLAYSLPGFAAGAEAFRELIQGGLAPTIPRLSDEEETRFTLAMAGRAGIALSAYLRARGQQRPCFMVIGLEGDALHNRRAIARVLRSHGAVALGPKPGAAWRSGRFHGPYLRDGLMTDGYLVETLETSTTWSNLLELYRAVGGALREALAPALVGCHISHIYPTGASLYFTFLSRPRIGEELERWQAAKQAAGDAIVAAGGTITHHHAIGADHAPWLANEVGQLGIELLRSAKATLDPTGIMNPEKLAR